MSAETVTLTLSTGPGATVLPDLGAPVGAASSAAESLLRGSLHELPRSSAAAALPAHAAPLSLDRSTAAPDVNRQTR